jgi:asparagine synthase (glutamine-hydrolysing)
MCGLCGDIRFDGSQPNLASLQDMADSMRPRGPDTGGFFAQGAAAFGHRRLSILDLQATGQQPMVDAELGLAVVFNGCIYNFRELRNELAAKGYRFFSSCDTEVILKAYHAWGARCVERFHGMFAFAIWERDSGRIVLARDRLGIKPMYLADVKGGLRFASTLPALLKGGGIDTEIDAAALHHYMTFHAVVPAPRTILKGVRKLPPATILTIEPDGRRREETYWTLRVGARREDRAITMAEWRESVLASLTTAGSTARWWSRCSPRRVTLRDSRRSRSASTASATSKATNSTTPT